jgi:type VI protein secretion system component VasF
VIACAALVAAALGTGFVRARAQSSTTQSGTAQSTVAVEASAGAQTAAGSPTPANAQTAAAAEPGKPPEPALATGLPPREIAAESADLLKMATALKSEVDKTTKDQLSITVVRKASEIEQLAHKARFGIPKS